MVTGAVESFAGRGADQVQWDPQAAPGVQVSADSDLVILALRQVIDNALKYSDPGRKVECALVSSPEQVQIRIADRGPGIPERDRERIFDKFYRHANVRERIPGTGLGLHIAREIARIHQGDLWVEANPAGGAIFCLSLPVKETAS